MVYLGHRHGQTDRYLEVIAAKPGTTLSGDAAAEYGRQALLDVTGAATVDARLIDALPALKIVSVHAVGYDLTDLVKQKKLDPVGMVKIGEGFFSSLGFAPLPATFYSR